MNTSTSRVTAKLALLAVLSLAAGPASAQVTLTQSPEQITVDIDGKPFTVFYLRGKDLKRPYLHPLRSASGKMVNRSFPAGQLPAETTDHPHHAGLFYGHGDVNGYNYWAIQNLPTPPSTADATMGRIVLDRVVSVRSGRESGSVDVVFTWLKPDGKALLTEARTMTFHAHPELRIVDFDFDLSAIEKVVFRDTKEGTFAMRVATALEEARTGKLANAQGGEREANVWGKRSEWVDYSGELDGERVGVVMMDHPGNPRHPTYWHSRGYGLHAINPFGVSDFLNDKTQNGSLTLAPGERVRFRYRVIIHPGVSRTRLTELYTQYARTSSAAQVAVEPASPRWGDVLTITATPNRQGDETQRFSKSDRLFVFLHWYRHGLSRTSDRRWAPMIWDGERFTAQLTLPDGCEAGSVNVATAERYLASTTIPFVCRRADGSLPPGGLIGGLLAGARDASNWKTDIADDLAKLKDTNDAGWEHRAAWLIARREDPTRSREQQLREVRRLEQEHPQPKAALLFSLVSGYFLADAPREAFARLRELCRRYPESEYTTQGIQQAAARPELERELLLLVSHMANASPENRELRVYYSLILRAPDVSDALLRAIATRWMADEPTDLRPYYYRATVLAKAPEHTGEAEALLTKALDLSFQPHPADSATTAMRERAFRLRATLRAQRGDVGGALADARMAQLFAWDKIGAEHHAFEAELWQRLGFREKGEAEAVEAYRKGSLKAESVLRNAYVARTGSEAGFDDDLIARLRAGNRDASVAVRPAPAFAAVTMNGTRIDNAALRGTIAIVSFWYVGCPAYDVELPKLNDLATEFGDRVRFVGFWRDPGDRLKEHVRTTRINAEIAPDSQHIAAAFRIPGVPHHVVLDRLGRIVWESGSGWDRLDPLRAVVSRLLAIE